MFTASPSAELTALLVKDITEREHYWHPRRSDQGEQDRAVERLKIMRAMRFMGRVGLWAIATFLWLAVLVAIVFMVSFIWVSVPEERTIAGIGFWITAIVGCPALLLTARLAGIWGKLFPRANGLSPSRPF